MRVCVIGSGVGLLAAAHYAARSGADVVVAPVHRQVSPDEQLFEEGGEHFACFHDPVRSTDVSLLAWLDELGLLRDVAWRDASFAIYDRELRRYVEAPTGLLAGDRLGLASRARAYLSLRRWLSRAPLSGDTSIGCWLERHAGTLAARRIARPLLTAACGEGAYELRAHVAQLLARSTFSRQGHRRWLRNGLASSLAEVRGRLATQGVRFHPGGHVQSLRPGVHGAGVRVALGLREEVFDAVVATGPPGDWSKLFAEGGEDEVLQRIGEPSPTGALSVVALVRGAPPLPFREVLVYSSEGEPLSWVHCPAPCRPASQTGSGLYPVYLTHRGPSHLGSFRAADSVWEGRARRTLHLLSAGRLDAMIETVRIFRARSIDVPLMSREPETRLPLRLGSCPVFLSTADRQPIRPSGPEAAVMAAREACGALAHLEPARPRATPNAPLRGERRP